MNTLEIVVLSIFGFVIFTFIMLFLYFEIIEPLNKKLNKIPKYRKVKKWSTKSSAYDINETIYSKNRRMFKIVDIACEGHAVKNGVLLYYQVLLIRRDK